METVPEDELITLSEVKEEVERLGKELRDAIEDSDIDMGGFVYLSGRLGERSYSFAGENLDDDEIIDLLMHLYENYRGLYLAVSLMYADGKLNRKAN